MKYHIGTPQGIDGSLFTVFDGTLANVHALSAELQTKPEPNEVVLAAYLKWGDDFLERLKGDFAVAVFDCDRNRLLLARDRFGTIPLYYVRISASQIAFSSRVDDFLIHKNVAAKASRQALWDYLSVGAIAQPRTILSGVSSLRGGEALWLELNGAGQSSRQWWDIREAAKKEAVDGMSFDDASKELRSRLEVATEQYSKQQNSSLLLLSGGIDSAVLLALLSRHGRAKTLTLGYESKHNAVDETRKARLVAEHFKADEKVIEVQDWDASKLFTKFLKAMDQPSRDGLNMFFATRLAAAAGARTVVTGLGGDELFGGYAYVRRYAAAIKRAKSLSWLGWLGRRLPERFRHNLQLPFLNRLEMLETVRSQTFETGKRSFASEALLAGQLASWQESCRQFLDESMDMTGQLGYYDLTGDMERTLLRDGYCQSRANGIALVSPMLDEAVAQLAFALPSSYKLRDGYANGKAVLLNAFRKDLPECLFGGAKQGFEMPLLSWLGSTLRSRAEEAFRSEQARLLFREDYCRNWSERLQFLQPRDYPLWSRFVLIEWLRQRGISDLGE